jgi:hypothetical protein
VPAAIFDSAAATCASTTETAFVQYLVLPESCPSSAPFHAWKPQMSLPPYHASTFDLNVAAAGVFAVSALASRVRFAPR